MIPVVMFRDISFRDITPCHGLDGRLKKIYNL
jgi:hypothetical protein